jgi:LPXTG-site transpeptidase (sortase) family protein
LTQEPARPPGRRAPTARRRAWRGLLLAGLAAGTLLVADGVLTILWQEPVTAFLAQRRQAALRDDLAKLDDRFARAAAASPARAGDDPRRRIRRLALALLHDRKSGQALGRLEIPKIGLRTVLVESTSRGALHRGPGHYRGTVLPGLDGTVGIAGHRTTYGAPFRRVDALHAGSSIVLRMPYGRFTYRVTGTRITTPDDASSLRSRAGTQRLVLTACHPLYSAAKRIVVSARLVAETAQA